MGENSKYSTYVLEMIRNNGVSEILKDENKTKEYFLMFDYFDVLLYRELEGDAKNYLEYLAISDPFGTEKDHKVSYKTLSLYQLKEKCPKERNPFLNEKRETVSDFPFLGIIQIILCKENYSGPIEERRETLDIEKFLYKCEEKILEIVEKEETQYRECVSRRQLYRSSTTGDFCLVLRADSVNVIYKIALTLSGSQDNGESAIKLMTYTNVGIECHKLENGGYGRLSRGFIEKHRDISFALRFSADAGYEKVLNKYVSDNNQENCPEDKAKGLFGRYDYLLNLEMEEFAEIYPWLCEKKLGVSDEKKEKLSLYRRLQGLRNRKLRVEKEGESAERSRLKLVQILEDPYVRNINERVLINLKDMPYDKRNGNEISRNIGDKNRDSIKEKNKELYGKIKKLQEYETHFSEGYRVFKDLYRSMIEIFKTYSVLGMEKDAYINWKIYHEDMRILCECLKRWIDKYERETDVEKKQKLRTTILYQWRMSIQAINQYTRLVQNVNYQTYQSPIYEIQTQIDTEKAMVAYREAIERYIISYADSDVSGRSKDRIYPILYPDLVKEKIEVEGLFMDAETTKKPVDRAIICTLPSFEYFGRLYDVLPWIIHETSHHIRVLDRERRNRFVVRYILSYIFQIVITDIMKKLASDRFYRTSGIAEFQLISCMIEVAEEELEVREEGKEYNFEGLEESIDDYLKKLFPFSTDDMIGDISDPEQLKSAIIEGLLAECRREEIVEEDTIDLLGAVQSEESDFGSIQSLLVRLLERYYETLKAVPEGDAVKRIEQNLRENIGRHGFGEEHLQWTMWQIETGWVNFLRAEAMGGADNAQWKDALKEYYSKVKNIFRINEAYREKITEIRAEGKKESKIRGFLDKVYERYKAKKESDREKGALIKMISDPSVMHIMRRIGLVDCNGNKDKELFCKVMTDMFKAADNKKIEEHKKIKVTSYREACADIMMAVSLGMDGFGYCRQVLQILSDTKVDPEDYAYEAINYERFRIVAGTLLWKEGVEAIDAKGSRIEFGKKDKEPLDEKKDLGEELMDEVKVDGSKLLENGKEYCLNTLKCIQDKVLENERLKKKKGEYELAEEFINVIYEQSVCRLGTMEEDEFDNTFLFILLHGRKEGIDCNIINEFDRYKKITDCFEEVKYLLWRLECFIRGLSTILHNGHIEVPKAFLMHMGEIYENIKGEEKKDADGISVCRKGCRWEKDTPESLLIPKADVGEFYNDPEKVYTKSVERKLENAIDFIQNYYYYNRFKVMRAWQDGKEGKES